MRPRPSAGLKKDGVASDTSTKIGSTTRSTDERVRTIKRTLRPLLGRSVAAEQGVPQEEARRTEDELLMEWSAKNLTSALKLDARATEWPTPGGRKGEKGNLEARSKPCRCNALVHELKDSQLRRLEYQEETVGEGERASTPGADASRGVS